MASSPDSLSASVSDSTSVRPISCNECRRRHTQCTRDRPRCQRCREVSIECIYEEGGRSITVKERYLRALELKAKAYDDALAAGNTQGPAPVPVPAKARPNAPTVEDDDEITESNALIEDLKGMAVHGHQNRLPANHRGSFKGPGHSDMFLRSIRRLPGVRYPDDVSLDLDTSFYEPGLLAPRRLSVRSHVRLPPVDTARRYYAAQYTYIGTILSFSDPISFERDFLEACNRPPPDLADSESCLRYAKMLVILAFGQLYSVNQWIDFKGPPGFEYFSLALQLLPDVHEQGSILCVETLSLIGYFMQNMNRRDAAFLYIGMALRMAISLGLHQEVSDPAVPETEREHRRRVWWSIYSLDRILSVKSGNPITIQDEDVGVAPPSRLPSEPEYCPAVVLRQYTELSRILGDVNKHIFRKGGVGHKSVAQLMSAVKDIMLALTRWHRELPERLRFDPARLAMSRESVSTLVHYYQCINMTARPLLFHVVKKRLLSRAMATGTANGNHSSSGSSSKNPRDTKAAANMGSWGDWKGGLSRTTINVIEMCVDAARDSINLMSIAAQRDLVATYGYMDSEHIFSASIVLLMVCIAFPPDTQTTRAMNMGLALLRGMAERGNSYVGARYQLLDHLRSMVAPQGATASAAPGSSSTATSAPETTRNMPTATAATSPVAPFASSALPSVTASPPMQSANQLPYGHTQSAKGSFSGSSQRQHPQDAGGMPPAASPAITIPNAGLQQRSLAFGPIPSADGLAYGQNAMPMATMASSGSSGAAHNFPPFLNGAGGFSPGSILGDTHMNPASPASTVAATAFQDDSGGTTGHGSFGSGFAPGFRLADSDAVEEMFFDVNMGDMTGDDYRLWEASFVDPSAYDLSQLAQAAEMAVDFDAGAASVGGGADELGGGAAAAAASGHPG